MPKFDDQFAKVRSLGRGGMGEVDLVRRRSDARLFAVKWVEARSPGVVARFHREQQILIGLDHPHIVRAFELGMFEDRMYVVLEYLPGESLLDVVNTIGPRPLSWVVQLGLQVCDALHTVHQRGVVHRDLKPGNLLYDLAGSVKVADFGCAASEADPRITAPESVLGTLRYMAPEQRLDPHQVDGRADLYSLAATLLLALNGKSDRDLFMWKHKPALFLGVPPDLAEILQRALSYDRDARPASARVFAAQLEMLSPA